MGCPPQPVAWRPRGLLDHLLAAAEEMSWRQNSSSSRNLAYFAACARDDLPALPNSVGGGSKPRRMLAAGPMQARCRPDADPMQARCRRDAGQMPVRCRPDAVKKWGMGTTRT